MIKELFPHDFDEVKKYIRAGAKQGRLHYREGIELVEIIENLQAENEQLSVNLKTQQNLNKHLRDFIGEMEVSEFEKNLRQAMQEYENERRKVMVNKPCNN